jgi:hypothetical protein
MYLITPRKIKTAILLLLTDRKCFWDRIRYYRKIFFKNKSINKLERIESKLGYIINTIKYKNEITDDIKDTLTRIENKMARITQTDNNMKYFYLINKVINDIKSRG